MAGAIGGGNRANAVGGVGGVQGGKLRARSLEPAPGKVKTVSPRQFCQ